MDGIKGLPAWPCHLSRLNLGYQALLMALQAATLTCHAFPLAWALALGAGLALGSRGILSSLPSPDAYKGACVVLSFNF